MIRNFKTKSKTFQEIKKECLQRKILFEDPDFPASLSSLHIRVQPTVITQSNNFIEWKRPWELVRHPEFIVSGATRADINQGTLPDCWLLSAIASLTLYPDLLAKVVPMGQSFHEDYAGIFLFRFCQYGEWVDVHVDDRLPTKKGELVFVQSGTGNEFWSALLEKAYAKLNGCYEALAYGFPVEALCDFTGGVGETFTMNNAPRDYWDGISRAIKKGAIICCGIEGRGEKVTPMGLVEGHAYSITGVIKLKFPGKTVQLIRVRNPYGKVEYTGPWSDGSTTWNEVPEEDQKRLHVRAEDGEFWISDKDFRKNFHLVEICHQGSEVEIEHRKNLWICELHNSMWLKGLNAGGSRRHREFPLNYQFFLTLLEEDNVMDVCHGCHFLLSLTQKHRRKFRKIGIDFVPIGIYIYKAVVPGKKLTPQQLRKEKPLVESPEFIARREVTMRMTLPPGNYIIIPCTESAGQEAQFLLRIFMEKAQQHQGPKPLTVPKVSPPPAENFDMEESFLQVAGKDKLIKADKLQALITLEIQKCITDTTVVVDKFSMESCRVLVALFDIDNSGQLGYEEFLLVWEFIKMTLKTYKMCDVDKSGTLSSTELPMALEHSRFKVGKLMQRLIMMRFSEPNLTISFDSFVCLLAKMYTAFNIFISLDAAGTGTITLNLHEWMKFMVYS
uniref:Calpain-1 catalytic subunit-like n=1 Tax=Petromyzon marinus TaxID=7757 RepID=A0AAJ7WVH0_PETMA|nr:calpain-1 catalytic subunit-like [Petromyzon marinus]